VERAFSWIGRQRPLSKDYEKAYEKDYERLTSSAEAFISLVGIRLLLARLTR
jgi:transposase